MKILITGGAGYIGYELSRALHRSGQFKEIRIYDNLSRSGLPFFAGEEKIPELRFIKGDILDSYSLTEAVKGVDVVVHMAAFVSQPYNHLQNLQYEQVNRWGSLNLSRIIRESQQLKKAIYLSSAAVYGFREDIGHGDEPAPENAYGQSKYHGEQYFELLKNHCDYHIIRAANVFGFNPCMRMDSVLNAWVFKALTEGKFHIYGSGEQSRAFVSLNELIQNLELLISDESKTEPISNCISFCASLNRLKDWLTEALPDVQYSYLNRNQHFSGQYFPEFEFLPEHLYSLNEHLNRMRNKLICSERK